MRRSSYALLLMLYVAALAVPALAGFVCASDSGPDGEVRRGHCPLAACGSGPGFICRTAF